MKDREEISVRVIPKPDIKMGIMCDERVNGAGELFSKEFIKNTIDSVYKDRIDYFLRKLDELLMMAIGMPPALIGRYKTMSWLYEDHYIAEFKKDIDKGVLKGISQPRYVPKSYELKNFKVRLKLTKNV